ncbi:MAG: hypothetical protein ABFS56_30985, partial [Pseudomonadota bacterium]
SHRHSNDFHRLPRLIKRRPRKHGNQIWITDSRYQLFREWSGADFPKPNSGDLSLKIIPIHQ